MSHNAIALNSRRFFRTHSIVSRVPSTYSQAQPGWREARSGESASVRRPRGGEQEPAPAPHPQRGLAAMDLAKARARSRRDVCRSSPANPARCADHARRSSAIPFRPRPDRHIAGSDDGSASRRRQRNVARSSPRHRRDRTDRRRSGGQRYAGRNGHVATESDIGPAAADPLRYKAVMKNPGWTTKRSKIR
jgi:hypothetical protein